MKKIYLLTETIDGLQKHERIAISEIEEKIRSNELIRFAVLLSGGLNVIGVAVREGQEVVWLKLRKGRVIKLPSIVHPKFELCKAGADFEIGESKLRFPPTKLTCFKISDFMSDWEDLFEKIEDFSEIKRLY